MSDEKKPQAKIVKSERVYDGFFKMDELTIEMDRHEGGTMTLKRLNFERGHAVAMLGYDPIRDEVLLVNEMRPGMLAAGMYPFVDALPAGMIDKNEDAITAAVREMHEEAGLELKNPRLIHDGAFVSSGGTSEKISLVVGIVDTSKAGGVHGEPGEGENIKTVVISANEFIQRAEDGRLLDMKSLVCAFWLDKHRAELRLANDPKVEAPKKKAGGGFNP